jgi:hypothetical protein
MIAREISILSTKEITTMRTGTQDQATANGQSKFEDVKRRIEQLNVALKILQREAVAGVAHVDQIDELEQQLVAAQKESEELQTQWDDEKELVDAIVNRIVHGRIIAMNLGTVGN